MHQIEIVIVFNTIQNCHYRQLRGKYTTASLYLMDVIVQSSSCKVWDVVILADTLWILQESDKRKSDKGNQT